MEEYGLLERLLHEQCHVGRHRDGRPGADDDDAEEGKVPVALREPKEVRSSSMQTPHDPEVTYSGHKGKGYEVQVSETCEEGNAVQMITHVEVTPSSGGDAGVTVGVIDRLRERGIGPSELWCDTSYGSGHNGWEAERRGTELVSPVGGRAPAEADRGDRPVKLTDADFDIDVTARRAAVCPAGHEAVSEYEDEEAPERVEMHFAREVCEPCSLRSRCPVRWRRRPELGGEWSPRGAYVLSADLACPVRLNSIRQLSETWLSPGLSAGSPYSGFLALLASLLELRKFSFYLECVVYENPHHVEAVGSRPPRQLGALADGGPGLPDGGHPPALPRQVDQVVAEGGLQALRQVEPLLPGPAAEAVPVTEVGPLGVSGAGGLADLVGPGEARAGGGKGLR